MSQNQELIEKLEVEIKNLQKRYHKAKIRIYQDAIDFLKMVDAESALGLIEERQTEDTSSMSYHVAAYSEAYEEVTRMIQDYLYKQKKAQ